MTKKILVIDDDRGFITLIYSVLRAKGYEVITATNGTEGFEKVSQEVPDLIILDVLMPEMTGYDFVQKIRKQDPAHRSIPIIVMSSRKSMKDFFTSWELAFFMTKPFEPQELTAKVAHALNFDPDMPTGKKDSSANSTKGKGKKVVVAGYDEEITSKVAEAMRAEGYNVFTAQGDSQGLDEVRKLLPDLVICHYHTLKGIMNVPKLFAGMQAKDETKSIPLFVVCPKDMESSALQSFKEGMLIVFGSGYELHKKMQKFAAQPIPV